MGLPSNPPADRTVTFSDNVTRYLKAATRVAVRGDDETGARQEMQITWAEMSPQERDQAGFVSSLLLADYL